MKQVEKPCQPEAKLLNLVLYQLWRSLSEDNKDVHPLWYLWYALFSYTLSPPTSVWNSSTLLAALVTCLIFISSSHDSFFSFFFG